jgi:dopamine beta-monooxygenase
MPLGGEDDAAPWVMVEIHYNNVDHETDVIDNSGFLLSLTPKLRLYDAGVLELGLIYSDTNSIPPGQPSFAHSSFCLADCTALVMPSP